MRLRFLLLALSLLISQISHASPVRYYADGVLKAWGSLSPYKSSSAITGWYELDWDNAKYEYDEGGWSVYSGILNYEFTIDNHFHIFSACVNWCDLTYYESEPGAPLGETDWMRFKSLEPRFDAPGALPIEVMEISIEKYQGVKRLFLSFYGWDSEGEGSEGSATLNVRPVEAPEPGTATLLLLGLVGVFYARYKQGLGR